MSKCDNIIIDVTSLIVLQLSLKEESYCYDRSQA